MKAESGMRKVEKEQKLKAESTKRMVFHRSRFEVGAGTS